ncbi:MAG: dethiobiotin synthase [Methylomonas sp.]|jgi:dethiobiotin synthetase
MTPGLFITGTDTNIGKTWTTLALMRYLRRKGYVVAAMKPVAAGCSWQDGRLVNQDALLLQQHGSITPVYEQVNPYAFELPVSPHLACGETEVDPLVILSAYSALKRQADCVLVEGAGGWLSPLGLGLDNAGLAISLKLPVIVVVGMRLGCINQARLTVQAVKQTGITCAGWVAVEIEPRRTDYRANLDYLQKCLGLPLLAELPHLQTADVDVLAGRFAF